MSLDLDTDVQEQDALGNHETATETTKRKGRPRSLKLLVKLSELGSIEVPNMEYLEEQLVKFGWEGLMPSRLSDQALLSLARNPESAQTHDRVRNVSEEYWVNAAAAFATKAIVFGSGKSGARSKKSVTPDGMYMATGHFHATVEREILARITGYPPLSCLEGDAACMRKLAQLD